MQLQAVAVNKTRIRDLYNILDAECARYKFQLHQINGGASLSTQIAERVPYFYIEFDGLRFIIGIKANKGFPLQVIFDLFFFLKICFNLKLISVILVWKRIINT